MAGALSGKKWPKLILLFAVIPVVSGIISGLLLLVWAKGNQEKMYAFDANLAFLVVGLVPGMSFIWKNQRVRTEKTVRMIVFVLVGFLFVAGGNWAGYVVARAIVAG